MRHPFSEREIVSYLLRRGLINVESIVGSDLTVEDASQRNRNFKIISERGPSYMIKQGVDPERIATLRNEALIYKLFQSADGNEFNSYLPHFYGYDSRQHILVLELINAGDLTILFSRRGHSNRLANLTGKALGALHSIERTGISDKELRTPLLEPPWILSIHRPVLSSFREISAASVELISIIQQYPELCNFLDRLREEWDQQTLIHFDMKWSNCIGAARKGTLKIVDWELAGFGAPDWDIGSIFNDYLSAWVLSIFIEENSAPHNFPDLAQSPLKNMHPSIDCFWQSYKQQAGLSRECSNRRLLRGIRYGAARLLQTAFEHTQMVPRIPRNMICLLQLSLNIFRRPEDALTQLMGLRLN